MKKKLLKLLLYIMTGGLAFFVVTFTVQVFSSCGSPGLLTLVAHGLLSLQSTGLGVQASVVLLQGLRCSAPCGILLDQG